MLLMSWSQYYSRRIGDFRYHSVSVPRTAAAGSDALTPIDPFMQHSPDADVRPVNRRSRTVAARLVAALAVLLVTISPLQWNYFDSGFLLSPDTFALIGLVAVLVLLDGDASRLGLRLHPVGGWWRWCRLGLGIGLALGVILLAYAAIIWWLGMSLPVLRVDPRHWYGSFVFMCVYAPVIEEIIHRSLLTVAVQPTLGDTATIVTSGIVFAAAHVAGGVASPENQIAGFLLAWAFLRSGTILVPMLWHSAGNLVALLGQIAAWYYPGDSWP
jgi:membrane protease YdiL (CAAX protease family)